MMIRHGGLKAFRERSALVLGGYDGKIKTGYSGQRLSGRYYCGSRSERAGMIVLSIGAFADHEFFGQVKAAAAGHGTRVYIASGAVGGFDVLRTISLMGQAEAGIRTRKGPASLKGTPLFVERLMEDGPESHVFHGNAKEAISLLPTKVNVAVASSLVTAGPEDTRVDIYSVPGMVGDDHKITSEIEGVKAVVDIYSSTSAIAGWSVVAVLQNIVSPIVF